MRDDTRFPWRWVGWGMLSVMITCVGAGWLWLNSDWDLAPVEARMKKAGLLSIPAGSRRISDPVWEAAQRRLPSSIARSLSGIPTYAPEWEPGRDSSLAQLSLIDLQEAAVARLAGDFEYTTGDFLIACIAKGTRQEITQALECILAGWKAIPNFGRARLLKRALSCLGERVTEPDAQAVFHECSGRLGDLIALDIAEGPNEWGLSYAWQAAHAPGDEFLRRMGIRIPAIYENRIGVIFLARAGRSALFEGPLLWAEGLRPHMNTLALAALAAVVDRLPGNQWQEVFPKRLLNSRQACASRIRLQVRTLLHFQLLEAHLNGAPWPDDPYAPAGTPLGRCERDGHVIAAYSIGPDGLDQHGHSSKDVVLPLGGVPGKPLATDPLPLNTK